MILHFNSHAKWFCMLIILLSSVGLQAQEVDNEFSLDAQLVTRGEIREGGFKADSLDKERIAHFEKRQLHWTWLMLTVKPQLFTTIWQDKN